MYVEISVREKYVAEVKADYGCRVKIPHGNDGKFLVELRCLLQREFVYSSAR